MMPMLSLFHDLLIRMFVIIGVFNFIIWWRLLSQQFGETILLLFIVEMAAVTLSLWFDIVYARKHFNVNV